MSPSPGLVTTARRAAHSIARDLNQETPAKARNTACASPG